MNTMRRYNSALGFEGKLRGGPEIPEEPTRGGEMLITCAGKNGRWHASIAYYGLLGDEPCPLCEANEHARESYDRGLRDGHDDAAKLVKLPPGEPDPRD